MNNFCSTEDKIKKTKNKKKFNSKTKNIHLKNKSKKNGITKPKVNDISNELSMPSENCLIIDELLDFDSVNPFRLFQFSKQTEDDSVVVGLNALNWLIKPLTAEYFLKDIFQKKALVVHRRSYSIYFNGFFSTNDFITMIQKKYVEYGVNINVALYKDGKRSTLNGEGRVYSYDLQKHFSNGHSIQCINPQIFNKNIWYLCEILQEVFCSFVGANNYITPKNAEGFAPHWDDVDAFLLQLEGRKHWVVCAPPDEFDALPINSSENFTDDILREWPVVFDGWLEEGDTLYIPRGFIHKLKKKLQKILIKAYTSDKHSHHVTVSVCRQFTYYDFVNKTIPQLLEQVMQNSVEFRKSLPPLLYDMSGVADINYSAEKDLKKKIQDPCLNLLNNVKEHFLTFCPGFIDSSAAYFLKTSLPPLLLPEERKYCCLRDGTNFDIFSSKNVISLDSSVRLIRRHAQRIIYGSENEAFIVHRMANSRVFDDEKNELSFSFPLKLEEGYNTLVNAYPNWIKSTSLNLTKENTIELIELFYKNCILMIKPNNVLDSVVNCEI